MTITKPLHLIAVGILSVVVLSVHAPSAAAANIPVKVIRFDDIKPAGATLDYTFAGIGLDVQDRVYATYANGNDTWLFRYDPHTGKREYLDSMRTAAGRVGNIGPNQYWNQYEPIAKGHTHISYLNGEMWLGTTNQHGFSDAEIANTRGGHLFAYNIATGVLTDHSQWQPKGVFSDRGGFYAVTVAPQYNLVVGLGEPKCDIITYNPTTRATTHAQGLPVQTYIPNVGSREIGVFADGDVLYQCGSADTPLGIYNINTGQSRATNLRLENATPGAATNALMVAALLTGDRKKAYLADFGKIYEFNTEGDTLRTLTNMTPEGNNPAEESLTFSLDQKKLYYVAGPRGMFDTYPSTYLYEYNLETGVRTMLTDLSSALGGSAEISGINNPASNGKIYFTFCVQSEWQPSPAGRGIIEVDVSSRTGPAPDGGTTPVCGNNICEAGETTQSCSADCKTGSSQNSVCTNAYTSAAAAPAGYGAAYNFFSTAKELLVQGENCTQTSFTVKVGSQSGQYVYKQGYSWNGSSWVPFTLTGSTLQGDRSGPGF